MVESSPLSSRFAALRERIDRAAERAGRSFTDITVIAVTKTVSPSLIRAAHGLGLRHFGENRVQEAEAKRADLAALDGCTWHLIGNLQTNKVKKALGLFDAVQSLDSERLADALNAAAGRTVPCLIEVKTSPEEAKRGMLPEDLDGFLGKASRWPRLKIEGLMTVAPYGEDPDDARPFFRRLRALGEKHGKALGGSPRLSMGMSHDFEAAIEEGATMIRIGTALFGERPTAPAVNAAGGRP